VTAGRSIRLERTLKASVDRVFRAFTDPADAVQWWGPASITTSVVEIDLRIGGQCRWVMHPDGGRAVLLGRIVELDPPHLLVMTNQWEGNPAETLVTLRLTAVGDMTRVELIHERLPDAADPTEFERGWVAAFNSLSSHLADERSPA
jgi:uncharacterized protein YndB with AHSA1/START domain